MIEYKKPSGVRDRTLDRVASERDEARAEVKLLRAQVAAVRALIPIAEADHAKIGAELASVMGLPDTIGGTVWVRADDITAVLATNA
jgi:outer membrane protein TolC